MSSERMCCPVRKSDWVKIEIVQKASVYNLLLNKP